MIRDVDVSGVSGTGKIAEAAVFSDGTTVLRWCNTPYVSTAVYRSLDECMAVHGHGGATRFMELSSRDHEVLAHLHDANHDWDHDYGTRIGCVRGR